jgi:hypothetical protein
VRLAVVQGPVKLWLSYALVMGGTWAERSRPLAAAAAHEEPPAPHAAQLEVAVVAPLKHEDDLIRRQQGLAGLAFRRCLLASLLSLLSLVLCRAVGKLFVVPAGLQCRFG